MKLLRRIALIGAPLAAVALLLAFAALRNGDRGRACDVREFEGSRFIVCVVDASRHDLRIAARDSGGNYLRGFQALEAFLGRDAQRVRFAMNAGMYDDRGAPIGLYISNGQLEHALSLTEGPGNFRMMPNGVFWQGADGDMHVDTSERYAAARPVALLATQSGPILVIDGELRPETGRRDDTHALGPMIVALNRR